MNEILVTSYKNPDLDGFASSVAYAEFLTKTGRPAKPVIFGTPFADVGYIMERFKFEIPNLPAKLFASQKNRRADRNDIKKCKIVLVDASDLRGVNEDMKEADVIEIIDHRKVHKANLFPNAKAQVELVGACATLIAEKFVKPPLVPPSQGGMPLAPTCRLRPTGSQKGELTPANVVEISKMSAVLLYGAIISNTINFQANTTTKRDKEAAKWLKNKIDLPKDFIYEMFAVKSDLNGRKLFKTMESECAIYEFGARKIGIVQLESVEAEKLAGDRKKELEKELEFLKKKNNLDFIFLKIIDLKKGINIFVANDRRTQKLLKEVFDLYFKDEMAISKGIIMRKEMVPIIKNEIDKFFDI